MVDLSHSSPGDETPISDETVDSRVKPDRRWQANRARYESYRALLQMGDAVLGPESSAWSPITGSSLRDQSYLRRLPGEGQMVEPDAAGYTDAWKRRRDEAAHIPVSAMITWVYVDTFSRQEVDRSMVRRILGDDIVDDVDQHGLDASTWLPQTYARGLEQGWVYVSVDAPSVADDAPSLYHQQARGARPYAKLYEPLRVYQIKEDNNGNVTHVLLRETEDTFIEWTPDAWYVLDEDGNELESGQNRLGIVPGAIFRANPSTGYSELDPPGWSAIRAIALIDLQILQHVSLLNDVMVKTGFPFFHLEADDTDNRLMSNLFLGAGTVFKYPAGGDWKAPPEGCARGSREHIDWLESLAYKIGGVHRRSQDSVEAHSGLSLDWENAPIYATVMRWARQLYNFEIKIWKLFALQLGKSESDIASISVVYPDDFSTRPVDQDLSHARAITDIYSAETMPTWVQIGRDALIRRVIERLVGHQRDVRAALPTNLVGEVERQKEQAKTRQPVYDTMNQDPESTEEDDSAERNPQP